MYVYVDVVYHIYTYLHHHHHHHHPSFIIIIIIIMGSMPVLFVQYMQSRVTHHGHEVSKQCSTPLWVDDLFGDYTIQFFGGL